MVTFRDRIVCCYVLLHLSEKAAAEFMQQSFSIIIPRFLNNADGFKISIGLYPFKLVIARNLLYDFCNIIVDLNKSISSF